MSEAEPIDFKDARDSDSSSWERADPHEALIERIDVFYWTVWLTDGAEPHKVALAEDDGQFHGYCDCDGWEYHDGPCAHLCVLRKADFGGIEDTLGQPVQIATPPRRRGDEIAQHQ